MAWSYVGLAAAFVSEIATRIPAFHVGALFGVAVAASTSGVVAIGALVIRRRVPRVVSRFDGIRIKVS
jgi:hypothetical protein